ncbi:hypothetical protein IE077_002181 [Cardiosporidium cionae]|uniref:RING-type domain-containing protein n=1 Tax=Cardiosporidium cionae TaxID=476202 RepID=A0ABQ7J4M9_9APIC|nr:hypothetical protein IE077_002181 [Cardiosporidium cionae]|eukprot:KAF8818142.1 hypothetical protein IE077_002181 [Cardiosporidium cionae]
MTSHTDLSFASFSPTSNSSLSVVSFSYLNGISTAAYRTKLNESIPSIGFYRIAEVKSNIESNLFCSICSGIDLNIVDAGCGYSHYFCKQCILEWITQNPICPHCQCSISASTLCDPSDSLYESLLNAEVFCNCQEWQGPFARLPAHLGYCHAVTVSCTYAKFGCKDRFSADLTSSHEASTMVKHLSLIHKVVEKLENRLLDSQERLKSLEKQNGSLAEILLETHPREYCLHFHEPLPRLFSVGRSLPFYGIIIEEYNFQKRSWETLCPIPMRGNSFSRFGLSALPNGSSSDLIIVGGLELISSIENGISPHKRQNNVQSDRLDGISTSASSDSTSSSGRGRSSLVPSIHVESSSRVIIGSHVFKYNVLSNSLVKLPALTFSRLDPIVIPLHDVLYVFGGINGNKSLTSFEVLQPGSQSWKIYNYPSVVGIIHSAVAYKDRIFVLHQSQTTYFMESISGVDPSTTSEGINCHPDLNFFSCLPFPRLRTPANRRTAGRDMDGPLRPRGLLHPSRNANGSVLPPDELMDPLSVSTDQPPVTSVGYSNLRMSRCAVMDPTEDVGTRLRDVPTGWKTITFSHCDKAVLVSVIDGLLYMLCERFDKGVHHSFSVQHFNDALSK